MDKQTLWAVTTTQEVAEVCRVFDTKEEAERYEATATLWVKRRSAKGWEMLVCDFESGAPNEDFYRRLADNAQKELAALEANAEFMAVVDQAKAASEKWPFGEDKWNEFFHVEEVPYGPCPDSAVSTTQEK